MSDPGKPPHRLLRSAVTFLRQPPVALEAILWLLLAGVVIGMRVYLWHLLPAYLWTRDAGSYAVAAFHWLDSGSMVFDGRRGPVYTLLIAAALKIFGSVNGVVWLQQGLGGLSILAIVAAARVWWGRVVVVPLFLCGLCLALYGLPLHLGQLIRNESTLFVLSSAAFCAWWLALKWNSHGWLLAAAISAGVLTMTKNVFVPFPLVLVGGVLFLEGHTRAGKVSRVAVILAGFVLPFAALKLHNEFARHVSPPQPQAGILFYGRTAQWTKLDGGIEPELKAKIRAEVEEYRARPKLDNNIVIKRTIVPHLARELYRQGKSDVELDRLCQRLAIEAVKDQPAAFWRQVCKDQYKLEVGQGVSNEFPGMGEVLDALEALQHGDEGQPVHPTMHLDETIFALQSHEDGNTFRTFHRLLSRSYLFQFYPVLETSLALCVLLVCTHGREREFFLGAAAVWFFNMVLLCTVGRPIERYLMPLVPIMFWALSGVIVLIWKAVLSRTTGAGEAASPSASGENPV